MSLVRTPVVFLDVGFTLTFIDGVRVAALAHEVGLETTAAAVEAIEPAARRELHDYAWAATQRQASADPALAHGGPRFFARLLALSGAVLAGSAPGAQSAESLEASATPALEAKRQEAGRRIWTEHLRDNIWCRVGDGVNEAIARLAHAGVRLAVVSNSEGTVTRLLETVGLARYMETIVDSWDVGVAKPAGGIFRIALERLKVAPTSVTMVGDSLPNDVRGGRNAGLAAALLDPFGDAPKGEDVPTFAHVPAFVDAFLS